MCETCEGMLEEKLCGGERGIGSVDGDVGLADEAAVKTDS